MENLRYTIKLDTKNGLFPELKIVRKEMDNITQSVKKTSGQFVKLTNICDKLAGINYGTVVDLAQNMHLKYLNYCNKHVILHSQS